MLCTIAELRNKQVVCIKSANVLGYVSDVEINTTDGRIESLVIFGRPRFFGLFGKTDDVVIPWSDIEVIGQETVLVSTDSPFCQLK